MNFAVGNVGKVENLAKKLKKSANFFEKTIANFPFFYYNIVKVVKSGAKCGKVVGKIGSALPICRLCNPIKQAQTGRFGTDFRGKE